MKPNPTVDLTLKTARVITTLKCTKNCSYCSNKMDHIKKQMKQLSNIDDLLNYDLICLTGGEPLLVFERISKLITGLRNVKPEILIYMYSSIWTENFRYLLPYLDGVHYTLHDYQPFNDNANHFYKSQFLFYDNPNKSYRLSLSPNITAPLPLIPNVWKEVRIKKWFSEKENIVPVHEDLFILNN